MKHDYELQIASILAAKEDNRQLDLLFEEVKKTGVVRLASREVLCWNWPREVNGEWIDSEKPHADGSWDKMGLNNSDVTGHYKFYWWKPSNWSLLWESIKIWAKDTKEIGIDDIWLVLVKGRKYFTFKRLLLSFDSLYKFGFKWHPFKVEQSRWFWVVDSLSSSIKEVLYDHAEDLIAQDRGFKDSTDMFMERRGRKDQIVSHEEAAKKAKELEESMSYEEKIKLLEEKLNLVKVSDEMWVNTKDYTVMTYDDSKLPFSMKDGWNYEQVAEIVKIWFKTMHNMDVKYQIVKDEEE